MAIMKAHPDVVKLMGHEPLTKYVVLAVVSLQLFIALQLRHSHPLSFWFLFVAYVVGGTANHNLFLAIHEITHNLAFKGIDANKALAVFANIPIGIPYSASFKVRRTLYYMSKHSPYLRKRYHLEHHKHLGEDGIDVDLPTRLELLCLNNVLGKTFFAYVISRLRFINPHSSGSTFQILFYALRPGFVRTQTLTKWHFINLVVQLVFDYVLVRTFGIRPLLYLLFSSFFAGSLHPCAGHFIAEHYVWDGLKQETYSYYGPLNVLAYNVRLFPDALSLGLTLCRSGGIPQRAS